MRRRFRAACALAAVLGWALPRTARALELVAGPYVQDVTADGFLVAFDTDQAADTEVAVGERAFASHGTRHEVRVTGQAAGQRVKYVLRAGKTELAAGEVSTATPPGRPLTFVVLGDTRTGADVEAAIAHAARAEEPAFLVHVGDLVPNGADEPAWRHFFQNERSLLRDVALYPAVGNHELYRDPTGEQFRRWFVLPEEGRKTRHYTFQFGDARFIVLDANVTGSAHTEETAWLAASLTVAEKMARHVFVVMHQPPLSMGGHCGAGPADADWVELFERHRVRAVFAGHDHAYQRMERNGIRYFITGGGGAPLYHERWGCPTYDQDARRMYAPEHHYLRVRISGGDVEVAALRPAGPPIEVVRFDDQPMRLAHAAPPLVAPLIDFRRWPVGAWGLGVIIMAAGLFSWRRVVARRAAARIARAA